MNGLLLAGLVATLVVIVGLSVWTGSQNKGGERKNSLPVVTGVIVGTLVGGSSTVGTTQLAYHYGMSAWWFTLGAGLSCLVLALVYAKPLRRSGKPTLTGMIAAEFGPRAGLLASGLSSVGTFINIISQIISATAVLAVVAPFLGQKAAVAVSAVLMLLYIIFGGTRGAGMVGIVKTLLLYVAMMACGVMVLRLAGGPGGAMEMVKEIENPEGVNFFSLFSRGVGTDIGAFLSVLLGVLTTQTYAQGVLSGITDRDGVGGALLGALLVPPIGIGGILVGLYMRANAALYPAMTAKTALTTFITAHMPPALAGVVLGGLLVVVLGSGAGLALGISSMLGNDIIKRFTRRFDEPGKSRVLSRVLLAVVIAGAGLLSAGGLGDTVLQFAFLSMGLRGSVVFGPLLLALWLPGRVEERYAVASIVISPLLVLVLGVTDLLPFDALFAGVAASVLILGLGLVRGRKQK